MALLKKGVGWLARRGQNQINTHFALSYTQAFLLHSYNRLNALILLEGLPCTNLPIGFSHKYFRNMLEIGRCYSTLKWECNGNSISKKNSCFFFNENKNLPCNFFWLGKEGWNCSDENAIICNTFHHWTLKWVSWNKISHIL